MSQLHRSSSYARRSKIVRAIANSDPTTKCWVCHRTQSEHGRPWHAGHVIDGHPDSALLPECEQCNTSKGAVRGNRMRMQGATRQW